MGGVTEKERERKAKTGEGLRKRGKDLSTRLSRPCKTAVRLSCLYVFGSKCVFFCIDFV